jgi:ubiquinone biosynthesis protein UbiJ
VSKETPALLKPLENLLNRRLEGNSDARRALANVDGESLAIKFDGVGLELYFHAREGRLRLDTEFGDDEPAAIISGTPLALAAMAQGAEPGAAMRRNGVSLHGDTAVAQGFQRLFAVIKPDWEDELSRLVGDAVAHRVGNFARSFVNWGRDTTTRMSENFAEFFTEESRDLPTRTETEEFFDGVDGLRSDVDRAEARLRRTERRVSDERD